MEEGEFLIEIESDSSEDLRRQTFFYESGDLEESGADQIDVKTEAFEEPDPQGDLQRQNQNDSLDNLCLVVYDGEGVEFDPNRVLEQIAIPQSTAGSPKTLAAVAVPSDIPDGQNPLPLAGTGATKDRGLTVVASAVNHFISAPGGLTDGSDLFSLVDTGNPSGNLSANNPGDLVTASSEVRRGNVDNEVKDRGPTVVAVSQTGNQQQFRYLVSAPGGLTDGSKLFSLVDTGNPSGNLSANNPGDLVTASSEIRRGNVDNEVKDRGPTVVAVSRTGNQQQFRYQVSAPGGLTDGSKLFSLVDTGNPSGNLSANNPGDLVTASSEIRRGNVDNEVKDRGPTVVAVSRTGNQQQFRYQVSAPGGLTDGSKLFSLVDTGNPSGNLSANNPGDLVTASSEVRRGNVDNEVKDRGPTVVAVSQTGNQQQFRYLVSAPGGLTDGSKLFSLVDTGNPSGNLSANNPGDLVTASSEVRRGNVDNEVKDRGPTVVAVSQTGNQQQFRYLVSAPGGLTDGSKLFSLVDTGNPSGNPSANNPGDHVTASSEIRRDVDNEAKDRGPNHLLQASAGSSNSNETREIFSPNVLRNILNSSIVGRAIINSSTAGELSESNQHELARIIAEHHVQTKTRTTSDDLRDYATAITLLFKQERPENYYIPRGGERKNFSGKIAGKINAAKRKGRAKENIENEHLKKLRSNTEVDRRTETSGSEAETQWLTLNQSPWNAVLEKWPKSLNARKPLLRNERKLSQFLSTFPHYTDVNGFQLIDDDYANLFPTGVNGFGKLKTIALDLKPYITLKATDPSADKLVNLLSHANEDVQIIALLLALNTVLPPIAAGVRYKPTIVVGQEDTVLFEATEENIDAKLASVYDGYRERNLPVVPKLVCLGSSVDRQAGRFFVCYPPLRYAVNSARRAIDILIKMTAVFALPYSKVSKQVWHFIASGVYNIPLIEQYEKINKLLRFYKS